MFGLNLFYIDERMLESLLRHIFKAISFNFDEKVRLRDVSCIQEAFTEEELQDIMQHAHKTETANMRKTGSDGTA
jgi:hypothetical protein